MKLKLNNDCNHGNSRIKTKRKKTRLGKENNWTSTILKRFGDFMHKAHVT